MSSGQSATNGTFVSAFHAALARQSLVVLAIALVLAAAWSVLRLVELRRALAAAESGGAARPSRQRRERFEAPARRLLRIGFGLLWLLDGLLQAQAAMPSSMPSQVIQPAEAGTPAWVQHLVNWAVNVWTDHPIPAATSMVWIQLGIGALLLVAPRGRWLRLAAGASVAWALVVWVFGEAFGSILAPGASWLFGAPGAVVFYAVAGTLLALPDRYLDDPRLGRGLLAVMGAFILAMAVLQAWPGRGYWSGGQAGAIPAMARQMQQLAQPGIFSSVEGGFARLSSAGGFAVNLAAVCAMALVGVGLMLARRRLLLASVVGAGLLCIATWVLVQDLGFLGGVGTDPNSMIPQFLLILSGYLVVARPAAPAPALVPVAGSALRERLLARPAHLWRSLAAVGMIGVVLLGAAPMALASVNPHADAIVWQASNGAIDTTDVAAPAFTLTDQHGRPVSLQSLRGRAIALTFLDPVCTSDCPLIAQEFRLADQLLGTAASSVEFVAVVANPLYRSVAVLDAFDHAEGLDSLRNWLFLTGSTDQLRQVWGSYAVAVEIEPDGSMVYHSDLAYVIDPAGRTRVVLGADPGAGSAVSQSSFAGVLDGELRQVLAAQ
jgi:cytochrome oxidase Cu insertion factor (SCO1/SenC/PrrC family)